MAPVTPPGFDRLSPFAVTVRRPEEVLQLNLDRYAVVILANVGNPSDALVSRLEQYVGDGGNLLIFVGDAVRPLRVQHPAAQGRQGSASRRAGSRDRPAAGGGGQADGRPTSSADLLAGPGLQRRRGEPHPAVANVRQMTRQPAPPSISRYMPIKLRNKQGEFGRAVAYYSNQQPAIAERAFGQGKVMLVNTSADASWNYLVYTSEYLVLMQELLR